MEITSDCIINKSPFLLRQGSRLVFKYSFLMPFALQRVVLLISLV